MKKIILTAVFAMSLSTYAQVKVPAASPKIESEQVVGLTEIELEYARPGVKGRTVFGDMIPYGQIWRTGANENTKISFSDDVIIGGNHLPKGEYALYTIPEKDSWTVIFYSDTKSWGVPQNWDDKKIALKAGAKLSPTDFTEYLTIAVNPIDNNSGELVISWEKTKATVPFEVPTQKKALQSIEKGLNAGTSSARDYFLAAQYLYTEDIELKKAMEFIEQSVKMSDGETPFYVLRQKALIQAKLGDKKGAIETAQKSSEAAAKAGNKEYVRMNEQSIKEWSE
ncbi:DUF2911 domain-containing protein [Avrilella dinanensis]|uniref:Dihydrolipoamide dehydrogenase n=1 Tax=Avrilella dinanensis TaxID=2008672 RepID=A0A2M9R5P4_9FLAO|nr:DUF2911 domain-containing protein [Avrilella dinanensis]PJR04187.1 dihydrolipoamide dehydrogenase [Avrilella dinanensis]